MPPAPSASRPLSTRWPTLALACFLAAGLGLGSAMVWRALRTPPPAPVVEEPKPEPKVSLDKAPDLLVRGLADPATTFPAEPPEPPKPPEPVAAQAAAAKALGTGTVATAHTDWGPPPRGHPPAARRLHESRQAGIAALSTPSAADAKHPGQEERLQELFRRMRSRGGSEGGAP